MNRREALQAFLGLSVAIGVAYDATAGTDLLQRFHTTYRNATTIRCTFTSASGIAGTIIAKRGGYYRVELPDRTIVSDAKTVYSATPSARTVILNTYRSRSKEVSLEKVFFDIMNIYRGTIIDQRNGGGTIRLTPPDANTQISGVSNVDVTIDKTMKVTRIVLTENGSTTSYTVSKMAIDPKVASKTFTFSPPKGWEIIDLR
ncbi:MAG: outer membrane lipoprotein carrier protein LolA [Ignavibacteria bacterium]|nr:outer membrane lipoprotein carrier protein LolA [Ignavibacteria bacterium]MBP6509553.1 outer membrane lipoprotein carrier protein LolA [Candidatus Kapabacteria bacterium]MBK6420153.1 outer membrane lipoprotein carrier protein LolA [Ignavibacteria bacterium]MBK6759211.1 outer membrane lipoprotein carrier protein LolA [Ignavibacteria bacterium]MBK7184938.1 outer membrane lipoprotein carrier protein LolA [Ignavibacteria bacterium]